MASSYIFHPVLLIATQHLILSYVLAFTPRDDILRPALFPIICLLSYLVSTSDLDEWPTSILLWIGVFGSSVVSRYLDSALLSRWEYEAGGPTSSLGGLQPADESGRSVADRKGCFCKRLRFGLGEIFTFRYVGTPWQVKGVSPFSREDPRFVPSKGSFLLATAGKLVLCLLALDLSGLGKEPEKNAVVFASSKVPVFSRLSEVTGEEVFTRILATPAFLTIIYFSAQAGYFALSLLSVLLGIQEVGENPPMFGSFTESWSLRQFWGYVLSLPYSKAITPG